MLLMFWFYFAFFFQGKKNTNSSGNKECHNWDIAHRGMVYAATFACPILFKCIHIILFYLISDKHVLLRNIGYICLICNFFLSIQLPCWLVSLAVFFSWCVCVYVCLDFYCFSFVFNALQETCGRGQTCNLYNFVVSYYFYVCCAYMFACIYRNIHSMQHIKLKRIFMYKYSENELVNWKKKKL